MSTNQYPKNFTRAEMLHSATGEVQGIKNIPENAQIESNMVRMANFLQNVRDKLCAHCGRDVSIRVLSGYRNPELNKAVGGSKNSAHKLGLAADIVVDRVDLNELALFVAKEFSEFDQIILEFDQWVHIGLSDGAPRRQLLTARKVRGTTIYAPGIVK